MQRQLELDGCGWGVTDLLLGVGPPRASRAALLTVRGLCETNVIVHRHNVDRVA